MFPKCLSNLHNSGSWPTAVKICEIRRNRKAWKRESYLRSKDHSDAYVLEQSINEQLTCISIRWPGTRRIFEMLVGSFCTGRHLQRPNSNLFHPAIPCFCRNNLHPEIMKTKHFTNPFQNPALGPCQDDKAQRKLYHPAERKPLYDQTRPWFAQCYVSNFVTF